jgi:hypothetical protein
MELLAELIERLGESRSPIARKPWNVVEAALDIKLPSDYKAWADVYPSMMLGPSVKIANLSVGDEGSYDEVEGRLASLETMIERSGMRDVFDSEGQRYDPGVTAWATYPANPGLLGWGSIVGGFYLAWYTKGRPEDWPIVLVDDTNCLHIFNMRFTEFVLKLIDNNLSPKLDTKDWITVHDFKEMWGYKTATIQGRDYRSIDFRSM